MTKAINFPQSLVAGFDSEQQKSLQKLLHWFYNEYVVPTSEELADLEDRVVELEESGV